jgi:hypothetical protein
MLWGVLCVATGGAIGFALDEFLPGKNTGFYSTVGLMIGLTLSTYLEQRERKSSWRWTALGALVVVWYLALRIFFKT